MYQVNISRAQEKKKPLWVAKLNEMVSALGNFHHKYVS